MVKKDLDLKTTLSLIKLHGKILPPNFLQYCSSICQKCGTRLKHDKFHLEKDERGLSLTAICACEQCGFKEISYHSVYYWTINEIY
jgi:NAD-dependent SIR2 family protein deacetylase